MGLIFLSFFAGILTILAPCVLPLLPIILGAGASSYKDKLKPLIIIISLSVSIIIFSLLLKVSTIFLGVDQIFLKGFSAIIIIGFGVITIFPNIWKSLSLKLGFTEKSNNILTRGGNKKGIIGDILVGFSLGPVFSSCSPTYGVILAVILPTSFIIGIINLIAYVIGLGVTLLAITILGQKFIKKIKWLSDPNGIFKKILGVIFILVGVSIFTGFDKKVETYILDKGFFDVTQIEYNILEKVDIDK